MSSVLVPKSLDIDAIATLTMLMSRIDMNIPATSTARGKPHPPDADADADGGGGGGGGGSDAAGAGRRGFRTTSRDASRAVAEIDSMEPKCGLRDSRFAIQHWLVSCNIRHRIQLP